MRTLARLTAPALLGAGLLAAGPAARAGEPQYIPSPQVVPHGSAPHARAQLLSDVGGRRTYLLILSTGDEVYTALSDFARAHHVTAAHYTALGAVHDVQVGWYDLGRKAYKIIPVEGQVEVVSMTGDIGVANGKPLPHTHIVVSRPDGEVRGGHLIHAVVSPTLEITLTEEPATLAKKVDEASGLTVFDPKP